MAIGDLERSFGLYATRSFGIALVVVGALLLVLAYSDQSRIDEIGSTGDPVLQHRVSVLEDRRDAYLVTSIGTLFLGLFAIGLLTERSTPTTLPEEQMISTARVANEVLSAFSLAGNAIYLPARHGLTAERIFIPATPGAQRPPTALTNDLILSPGKDGSAPGILMEPLGRELLDRIEKDMGTNVGGIGLEAMEGSLQVLKHGLGMMKDFHFKERDGKTVLRVEYSGLREACRTVRRERPDTCRQAECVGCSCLLTAAARATEKVVSVEEVDNKQDTIIYTLAFREW